MKQRLQHLMTFIIFMIFYSSIFSQTIPNDSLYLGQIPPGNSPKIFQLPASSGLRTVERITISSDGKEIYYCELNTYPPTIQRVKCFKYLENKWQGPFLVFEGFGSPRLSVNDSILYVQTNIAANATPCTFYSRRNSSGWTVPARLLSTNQQTHYFQQTKLNNYYVSSIFPSSPGNADISKLVIQNKDTVIQNLGLPVNTSAQESDFYIAGDESYLIICRNPGGSTSDLYISYKKNDGSWTNPKILANPISTPSPNWEYGPYVSKDNKYLFFTRGAASISSYFVYWVRIDNIIDSLKHTNFAPYIVNNIPNLSATVNSLFNYTVPDNTFIDDDGNNTLTYTASYNSGDPLPNWLSFDPVTRTFSGTPTAPAIGRYSLNLKVTATDNAHESISCNFNLSVLDQTAIENKKLPAESKLFQNYPNPFNPTTVINYSIASAGNVTLKIDNVLGKEVMTLVNTYKQPGNYEAKFDGTNFSSGVYFYRIQTGNFTQVNKMILIK